MEKEVESYVPDNSRIEAKNFLDQLMPVALIGLLGLFLFHFIIPVSEQVSLAVNIANIGLIGFFAARFILAVSLADSHTEYLRQHWFDALIILPALGMLKEVRLFTILESKTEGRAFMGFFFARNTTLAGQLAKMYNIGRRTLRLN